MEIKIKTKLNWVNIAKTSGFVVALYALKN